MKVTFQQSGGFAGLFRGFEINLDELAPPEAAGLKALYARVPPATAGAAARENARDLIRYEVSLATPAGERSFVFDDLSVPPELQPVFASLKKRAKPRPPP